YCNATGGLQIGVFGANQTCAALTSSLVCQNPGSVSSFYYQWTAAANQCYYINVDGFAGTACNYSITAGSIIVLPIELLSFDVNAVGNKSVDLSWATASEKNNDYFTVERSQNGTSFELVEVVDGAGNSTALLNYASKDVKPLAGTTYYRLKQTDYDGRISYSSIKEVTIDMNADLNFTIYPNPSGENDNPYLAFSGNSDETVTISIYDVTGKMMSQKSVRLDQAGNSAIELKQTFVSGIYFVNASSASGKSINQKLIIK
ncbi:MAG TPA: T9SS type A sorting domain-containing protein, partial [Bacteroidia bacterium]